MKRILLAEPVVNGNEEKYLKQCIETGYISSVGSFVNKFEESFSNFCDTKFGIAVTNGTASLHVALEAIGVKSKDEVILPTLTMIGSADAIVFSGAKMKLVDSEMKTWNMDVSKLEKSITKKTKAIMVVHLYGHPVDMDPVMEIANKYNLFVVEDVAEAHGAEYKGKKTGGIGHVGCFSFYANKIITTGEGGMVITNDKKIAENAKSFRNMAFDKERRFKHKSVAFNYRMSNLQAAVGQAQVERINQFIERRRQNAKVYNEILSNIKNITLPAEENWAKNVYWMYTILTKNNKQRELLMKKLDKENIESRVMFNPMHLQKPFKSQFKHKKFPTAEKLSKIGLNLPSGNNLTDNKIQYISEKIKKIMLSLS